MKTKQETFRMAYPNLDNVLVELVLGSIAHQALLPEYELPEYLMYNLGRLEDLARGTRYMMSTWHNGKDKADGAEAAQVIAYGIWTDKLQLLTDKPELYLLYLFLRDVSDGDLNKVFLVQKDCTKRIGD